MIIRHLVDPHRMLLHHHKVERVVATPMFLVPIAILSHQVPGLTNPEQSSADKAVGQTILRGDLGCGSFLHPGQPNLSQQLRLIQ